MTAKKNQKKNNLKTAIWIGWATLVLIFIILSITIPSFNHQTSSPASTESTPESTTTIPDQNNTPNNTPSKTETPKTKEPEPRPETESKSEPTPAPESTTNPSQTYTTPSVTQSCYHEEDGRCWDGLEDEAYSAGLYDSQFGYYGATLEYAEDCNALCREIIEDAYDEGYADGM